MRLHRWTRRSTALAAATAAALVAGCGGGLYLGLGDDGWDEPPEVALAAAVTQAAPGAVVRLVAAASDDHGVEQVDFYRLDAAGAAIRLGSDGTAPWQWDALMPDEPGSTQRFFARAVDGNGQATDSAWVEIVLTP